MEVPDPERRRAANAALGDSIEEVCRHYAPSGARVEDCWEVREAGDGAVLRVFLTGPMRGSWTDAATGARGDALDLVARLCGLDAAGALAEAERFLKRDIVGAEPKDGDGGGGQMGLFGALPESGGRKRPARRSGKARNAAPHEPLSGDPVPRPGDDPEGAGDAADRSQESPDAPAPENRKQPSTPDDAGFTAADRQRLRKAAEDAAWLRSRQTARDRNAEAHARAKGRRERHGRRWRRAVVNAVAVVALAAVWLAAGVALERRHGVGDLAGALGAGLAGKVRILTGGDDG